MGIPDINAFANQARTDPSLAEKLRSCQKVRELLRLAKDCGYELDEAELYPPNAPQFTHEQLSPKLADALLRS